MSFLTADGAAAQGEGRYDLVTIFEAVHDLARPVEVLAAARRLLHSAGLSSRRRARRRRVHGPGRRARAAVYGFSVTCCLPCGLAGEGSVGTGTVLRPAALEAMARDAGFGGFAVLPVEHDSFQLYRLDP